MALLGATLRMIQAGYYALTEENGWASGACGEALDKAGEAMKRPPLAEGFDILGEWFD